MSLFAATGRLKRLGDIENPHWTTCWLLHARIPVALARSVVPLRNSPPGWNTCRPYPGFLPFVRACVLGDGRRRVS